MSTSLLQICIQPALCLSLPTIFLMKKAACLVPRPAFLSVSGSMPGFISPVAQSLYFLQGRLNGIDRLPAFQNGIIAQMTNASHGIGVVLEHRYYGESNPIPNYSTQSLRFLTTKQALADVVYFAQNVVFTEFEKQNLTSWTTPYIGYGRSYSGAQSAFLRVQYPYIYWGTIAGSSVSQASRDFWQYFQAISSDGEMQGESNQCLG